MLAVYLDARYSAMFKISTIHILLLIIYVYRYIFLWIKMRLSYKVTVLFFYKIIIFHTTKNKSKWVCTVKTITTNPLWKPSPMILFQLIGDVTCRGFL